jgi:hypothetical protein
MAIHWENLLGVFVVSFGATVAVVALVTLALLGLSPRAARLGPAEAPARPALFTPTAGPAVAAACLVAAALIVLLGLWAIVAR